MDDSNIKTSRLIFQAEGNTSFSVIDADHRCGWALEEKEVLSG
jgi:hypothetical protein